MNHDFHLYYLHSWINLLDLRLLVTHVYIVCCVKSSRVIQRQTQRGCSMVADGHTTYVSAEGLNITVINTFRSRPGK